METKTQIEIYGAGCGKFFRTVNSFTSAVRKCGVPWDVRTITDGGRIAARGALNLPAVFINGRLISQGEGISEEKAVALLS